MTLKSLGWFRLGLDVILKRLISVGLRKILVVFFDFDVILMCIGFDAAMTLTSLSCCLIGVPGCHPGVWSPGVPVPRIQKNKHPQ